MKQIGRDFRICWTKPGRFHFEKDEYGSSWYLELYWITIYSQAVTF